MQLARPRPSAGPQRAAIAWLSGLGRGVTIAAADRLPLTLLSFSYTLFALLLMIRACFSDGKVIEREEWQLYVYGGPVALSLGAAGALLTQRLLQHWSLQPMRGVYAGMLLAQIAFWAFSIWAFRLMSVMMETPAWEGILTVAAACFVPVTLLGVSLGRSGRMREDQIYGALPLVAGFASLAFLSGSVGLAAAVVIAVLLAGLVVTVAVQQAMRKSDSQMPMPALRRWANLFLPAAIPLLLLLTVVDPGLHIDRHHHNFFLGPMNDILAGKTVLVETFSQYGVAVMYALAAIFGSGLLPAGYSGMSLVLSALYVLQFLTLYALFRATLQSVTISRLGVLAMVLITYFGQQSYAQTAPSTGPLRFGLPYALMLCAMLRSKHPHQRRYAIATAAVIGVSSLWSIETFVYVVATYLAMEAYAAVEASMSPPMALGRLLRQMLPAVAAVVAVQAAFALFVFVQAGQLPEWLTYFDYVNLYVGSEFGTFVVPMWTPWAVIAGVYGFTLLALGSRLLVSGSKTEAAWRHCVMIGMAVFGTAQLSYFVGRSHPNNLYHVAIPALFLSLVWLDRLKDHAVDLPPVFRRNASVVTIVAFIVAVALHTPSYVQKFDATLLGAALSPEHLSPLMTIGQPHATDARVRGALELLMTHAPTEQRVVVLIEPELAVETYVASRRANVFPVANTMQEVLLPESAWGHALGYVGTLKPGATVLITDDLRQLNRLQQAMLRALCAEFEFRLLERHASGVVAVTLAPLSAGQPACTWRGVTGLS